MKKNTLTMTTKWAALPILIAGQLPHWMLAEIGATVSIWLSLWGLLVSIVVLSIAWACERWFSHRKP